ncbi:hypothetical protein LINPERPRIM_LOCUS36150 [Linum perenne]
MLFSNSDPNRRLIIHHVRVIVPS